MVVGDFSFVLVKLDFYHIFTIISLCRQQQY